MSIQKGNVMSTPSPFSAIVPQLIANIANPYAQEEAKGSVAVIKSVVAKLNTENEKHRTDSLIALNEQITELVKGFDNPPTPLQQVMLEVLESRLRSYKD